MQKLKQINRGTKQSPRASVIAYWTVLDNRMECCANALIEADLTLDVVIERKVSKISA